MDYMEHTALIGQLAIGMFIAIVFLQSGLDKVFDWKGNHSWITDHFKDTFLSKTVTPMLAVITITEVVTGLLAICGAICLLWCGDNTCIFYSVMVGLASLLMLLFGQRIAKDYEGAKTISIYFGVLLLSLLFF